MAKVSKAIKIDIRLWERINQYCSDENRGFSNAVETLLLMNFDMLPLPILENTTKPKPKPKEKVEKFTNCKGVFERDGYDISISKDVFICNKCKRIKYNLMKNEKCKEIAI